MTLSKGELEKLQILAYSEPDYRGAPVGEFRVMFNPEEYTQTYAVDYKETQGAGTTGSPMVFRKIKPQEYTLKLYFDGTGAAVDPEDIYEKIQSFFRLIGYDGEMHRPRFLKLIWGKLESRCVLVKADVVYKMFYPDGTPLRAIMTATFSENVDDKTRVKQENASSPDLTHVRTVKDGDTLMGLTTRIYGDVRYYLAVAEFNGLDHFQTLKPGTRLVFPPIEKGSYARK